MAARLAFLACVLAHAAAVTPLHRFDFRGVTASPVADRAGSQSALFSADVLPKSTGLRLSGEDESYIALDAMQALGAMSIAVTARWDDLGASSTYPTYVRALAARARSTLRLPLTTPNTHPSSPPPTASLGAATRSARSTLRSEAREAPPTFAAS
jgi:hypothetical protein